MLLHPLLTGCGVRHAFGSRSTPPPADLLRPRQVHGCEIVAAADCRAQPPPEADGVISSEPGVLVGVVTADCVPILVANGSGRVVAAIHAGWRGLARGVVAAGMAAVRERSGAEVLTAVVGPHIGSCCYEVDDPVLAALEARFGSALAPALRPGRAGHAYLDLGALAIAEIEMSDLGAAEAARIDGACTCCDVERFHSHRRDGPRAGRLVHFIAAGQP